MFFSACYLIALRPDPDLFANVEPDRSFWEVLPNKAISVLVGTSLPWALWVTEIYWHACIGRKICMFGQLHTTAPDQ
jgi:hypothetical protein